MSINFLEIGSDLSNLIKKINKKSMKFINKDLIFKINESIVTLFPKLNKSDVELLSILIQYLIEYIAENIFNLDFSNIDKKYYDQFTQNDNQDIKSICLILLPFINNKDDNLLLKNLSKLKYIIFNSDDKVISNDFKLMNEQVCRKKYFI